MKPLHAALLLLILLPGCSCSSRPLYFNCDRDEQCERESKGMCVRVTAELGFCAFRDPSCASGYKYDHTAGDQGRQCVMFPDGGEPDLSSEPDMAIAVDLAGVDHAGVDLAMPDLANPDLCAGPIGCASVIQVAAGDNFTCVLLSDETVRCWGANNWGQLGLGAGVTAEKHTPEKLPSLSAVKQIAAGGSHACAVLTGGTVSCWGYNQSGQLGRGTKDADTHPAPDAVLGLGDAVLSLGLGAYHTCAVLANGKAQCWGANDTGQLGDGSPDTSKALPSTVCAAGTSGTPCSEATGILEVAGGGGHSCARLAGSVACWGFNFFGELGFTADSDPQAHPNPITVTGVPLSGTTPAQLTLRNHSTCVRVSTGRVQCWGENGGYQLGRDGTAGPTSTPQPVCTNQGCSSLLTATHATLGDYHACGVVSGAVTAVTCWGKNDRSQMGDGTSATGYDVAGSSSIAVGAVELAAGALHTCARMVTGDLKCWGSDSNGQLGDNDTQDKNTPRSPLW